MPSDEQLVRQCLEGQRRAFDRLYDRHERRVFGLLRRRMGCDSEAADLSQETFLAAYRTLGSWQRRGAFGTWLCGIAVRLAANARRRETGRETDELLDDSPLA